MLKLVLIAVVLALAACTAPQTEAVDHGTTTADHETATVDEDQFLDGMEFFELYRSPSEMLQLQPPLPGEELIVLHTTLGDITLRFFPDEAPMAVENFLTHARNGYYDGVIFHRVVPGFMIQGGDPTGTGMGGESIWGESFGFEFSPGLRHFRGALAMAHAGGAMGSQFYIVQADDVGAMFSQHFRELIEMKDDVLGWFMDGSNVTYGHIHPVDGLEHFIEHGGTPSLDWFWNDFPGGPHTVFGHVVDGMDVVDAIAIVPRNENDRPNVDVIIERISFVIYG